MRVAQRDRVAAALAAAGIGTGLHSSPALQVQPPLAEAGWGSDLSTGAIWGDTELSLPIFPGLATEEVERVSAVLFAAIADSAER